MDVGSFLRAGTLALCSGWAQPTGWSLVSLVLAVLLVGLGCILCFCCGCFLGAFSALAATSGGIRASTARSVAGAASALARPALRRLKALYE